VIWADRAVRVRAPATSANLGPGFDALGLALALYDIAEARVTGSGLSIEVRGEGQDTAGAGERHLVVRAMRAAFTRMGGQPPGLALRCENAIPHGRGLGSSAAAVCSGLLAARGLAADGTDRLPGSDLLQLAVELEGHPDNVAACLAGGLTVAWQAGPDGTAGTRTLRVDVLPTLTAAACVPPFALSTEAARAALPASVPHGEAAADAGRSALLMAALTREPAVLYDATEDFLHQRYRAAVLPQTADLLRRLRAARLPAVISGAGPSVLVLAAGDQHTLVTTVDSIAAETGIAWHVIPLDIDRQGATFQPAGLAGHPPSSARDGRLWKQAQGPGAPPAGGFPQGLPVFLATQRPMSRECRGLLWC
jgi:homoserine kinase